MWSAKPIATRLTIDCKTTRRSDRALIESCLRGDRTAWDGLVKRYGRLVYSVARRYGLDNAEADDAFLATFVSVFEELETVKHLDRLSAWLITTTYRQCGRTAKRTDKPSDVDQRIEDVNAPSDEQVMVWEQQQLVRQALEMLGGRCELLLTALFTMGAPPAYEQIAQRLGMKAGSIGPMRARCFCSLVKILRDLGFGPSRAEEPPSSPGQHQCGWP